MKLSRRTLTQSTAAGLVVSAFACSRQTAPSSDSDLASPDAISTAQAVRDGEVAALEVVNSAIARAEKINPAINAIVTPYFDTAREKAASAADGPWFGVPTFIKDLNDVIGQRTTYGSRAFRNNIATTQSPYIDKMFEAGMISLGKSSTPEFGLSGSTEPLLHEPTRNPWNVDHSSGGSSGGAAALVAAGVTPVAHASDGGGSIRIPAACCGTVGLKPSRQRMTAHNRPVGRPIYISEHCIESRTVRDTAAFLSMLQSDGKLPHEELVSAPSPERRKIRFFVSSPAGGDVDPEVIETIEATAKVLEGLGHDVSEIDTPFDAGPLQDFTVYWGSGAAQAVARWEQLIGRKADYQTFEPWTYGVIDYYESRRHTLPDVIARLKTFERDYAAVFSDTDLLVSPVLATQPPKIGHLSPSIAFPLKLERVSEIIAFTQFQNVSGAPAISLPLGMSRAGLPIGVQIAGAYGAERKILELSYELESALPWAGRSPKLVSP